MRSLMVTILIVLCSASVRAQATAMDIFREADALQTGQASVGVAVRPFDIEPFRSLEAALQNREEAHEVLREASFQIVQRRRELTASQLELRLFVIEALGGVSSSVQDGIFELLKHPHPHVQWRALMAIRKLRGTHNRSYQIHALEFLEWIDDRARRVIIKDLIGDEGPMMPRARVLIAGYLERSAGGSNLGLLVLESLRRSRRFYDDPLLADLLVNSFEVYKRHRILTGREGDRKIQITKGLKALLGKAVEVAVAKNVHSELVDAHIGQIADEGVLKGADEALNEFIGTHLAGRIDRASCDNILRMNRYF